MDNCKLSDYKVTITEVLQMEVTIKATSRSEAENLVQSGYFNCDYVLDASNFKGVKLHTQPLQRERAAAR